ncbi:MAG: right-handed parallel beta-helix repeat-containing protein, partial [Pirellulaceae bacterium]
MRLPIIAAAVLSCFALLTQSVATAEQRTTSKTFYVDPSGDNENPGTRREPWQSIQFACLQLSPGDTLKVANKEFPAEGNILVRFVDPETYEYLPLEGTSQNTTRIVSYGRGRMSPRVHGKFDIRGSHIQIHGLEIIGSDSDPLPGVGVYQSHHISISDCSIHNHGGGGINFNHSDCVTASYNRVFQNAKLNPDQHSGISSYQPIVRSDDSAYYGVILNNNVCYHNENLIPAPWSGEISDGNGIAIDDHRYTQLNQTVTDAIKGTSNPALSSGQPIVQVDDDGQPLPYSRHTLVMRNQCLSNGGRGIHLFQSDHIDVVLNFASRNLQSPVFSDGLPRD